jgi:hypothetical protein
MAFALTMAAILTASHLKNDKPGGLMPRFQRLFFHQNRLRPG